jgi:hypothetical protein
MRIINPSGDIITLCTYLNIIESGCIQLLAIA